MGGKKSKLYRICGGQSQPPLPPEISSCGPEMMRCGLLTSSEELVPLRSVSVSVLIRGFVADVRCELTYRNEESGPVEAVFVFPLDVEAAVYAFQAQLRGTCIQAQLWEKKQAQELYGDALTGGQSSFLLQQEGTEGDVFSCSLGNLPPGEEAKLTLHYVCELSLEPDGAARYLLPTVLHPRYTPPGWSREDATQGVPRVAASELPYTLSLSATLQSPHGIDRVLSNCTLTPLSYAAGDRTSAQVSLAQAPPWDRDVELLVYYAELHKPNVVLEAGLSGAESGSLMGDPAVMVTLLPSGPKDVPAQSLAGEFIFLLDCSGSMQCLTDSRDYSHRRIDSAKETLILLLKSLPLGCYFNIYGFGSRFKSFYPRSVKYTQQTMAKSLQHVRQLQADMGGTEILAPLQAIYRSPCKNGHPRQLFVFTDGEVGNIEDVIAEVQRHRDSHRCFSFGIGDGASTALIKGIAQAGGGCADFITGQDRMQRKALQSLKRALQVAVTGISLSWDLPPGMQAELLGQGPEVIFCGQRCLIFAQIRGQPQSPDVPMGGVRLQYCIQDQAYQEMLKFPLQPQDGDRLPVHRLAAKSLLLELEGPRSEGDQRRALETSLSSGVICSLTAYVGVDTDRGQPPVQGPLLRRDILLPVPMGLCCPPSSQEAYSLQPCTHGGWGKDPSWTEKDRSVTGAVAVPAIMHSCATAASFSSTTFHLYEFPLVQRYHARWSRIDESSYRAVRLTPDRVRDKESAQEDSPLLQLVCLQNADGSWDLNPKLVVALGVSEADIRKRMPREDVSPGVWATVLAVVWLHGRARRQRDEWELLEAKAVAWVRGQAGSQLSKCLEAANALLGCSVGPAVFGL